MTSNLNELPRNVVVVVVVWVALVNIDVDRTKYGVYVCVCVSVCVSKRIDQSVGSGKEDHHHHGSTIRPKRPKVECAIDNN